MPKKKISNPIVVEMRRGFKEMRKGFESVDRRFESVDRRFESVDRRFESVDRRFSRIDKKLENIADIVGQHDKTLKTLVTRDEFNEFKKANLNAHENLGTSLEKLDQEFVSFTRANDRLKERVDTHEAALQKHKMLPVAA